MAGRSEVERLTDENKRLRAAILDIDAHATGMGEDEFGFVSKGYIITIGSLHRALGVIGHTSVKCRTCNPKDHDCLEWAECEHCDHPIFKSYRWNHQGGTPPQDHDAEPR